MRRELTLHPDCICRAVARIEVEVAFGEELVGLSYLVIGDIAAIVIPAITDMARVDELWKHTCFEAFVQKAGASAYMELNFAPSTQWASYRFDAYRAGMRNAEIAPDHMSIAPGAEIFGLEALCARDAFAGARLGLSAVIEETDGNKSYWALKHPPGKPDFHNADSFCV